MRGREQATSFSVESGVQGYIQRMRQYPKFSPEQNALALDALRSGGSIDTLRALSSFSSPTPSKQASYELLFTTCTSLDMVLAYGNFPLIRAWGTRYARDYPNLAPFPLEEYFQDALWRDVPRAVRGYRAEQGSQFTTWVSTMLIWRLEELVDQRYRDLYSLPEGYQPWKEGLKPRHDPHRRAMLNLDQPVNDPGSDERPVTLAETIADPTADTENEALANYAPLRQLYQLARITGQQEEVLTALFVRGEEATSLAARLQRTDRAIRSRREKALAALHTLPMPMVQSILSGDVDEVLKPA